MPCVLTINGGSSSIRFAVHEAGETPRRRLDGLDTLVFSGGIGENAPLIRARICDGLQFPGIDLERRRNAADADVISAKAGRVCVRVIRTDEERMIARTVFRVLALG